LWAHDDTVGGFVLVLITQFFDFKGPLEISKLLFKAYNSAGTPREVDPFIVRLHSPDQKIVRELMPRGLAKEVFKTDKVTHEPIGEPIKIENVKFGDLMFCHDWVYKFQLPPKRNSVELLRRWQRFERNVDRLAA
jgi:hypothetical protein